MSGSKPKSGKRYDKVNSRFYKGEGGKADESIKMVELLWVRLFDIEVFRTAKIADKDQFTKTWDAPSIFRKAENTDEEHLAEAGQYAADLVTTEGKDQSIENGFRAKAVFTDRRINLFKDGQVSKALEYETADFVCREGDGVGSLTHVNMLEYERDHAEPFLRIQTYLPGDILLPILRDIEGGQDAEVHATLQCDVFQSNIDRSFAEPWMTQHYTIEEGSQNFCGIRALYVTGQKHALQPPEDDLTGADKRSPIPPDARRLPALLVEELRKTNRTLKLIVWVLGIAAAIALVSRLWGMR
jgi:hypothetical protein